MDLRFLFKQVFEEIDYAVEEDYDGREGAAVELAAHAVGLRRTHICAAAVVAVAVTVGVNVAERRNGILCESVAAKRTRAGGETGGSAGGRGDTDRINMTARINIFGICIITARTNICYISFFCTCRFFAFGFSIFVRISKYSR